MIKVMELCLCPLDRKFWGTILRQEPSHYQEQQQEEETPNAFREEVYAAVYTQPCGTVLCPSDRSPSIYEMKKCTRQLRSSFLCFLKILILFVYLL